MGSKLFFFNECPKLPDSGVCKFGGCGTWGAKEKDHESKCKCTHRRRISQTHGATLCEAVQHFNKKKVDGNGQ
ncbi:MAG TPA: hypothetical protein DIS73_02935 [Planctomycetia bacterium]|nr:hypothetical protein [Planctomycetia bacterium]